MESKKIIISRTGSNGDGDLLSSLPDPILRHILSSLDAKHAVRTSVLSSKYRDFWKSLSHLNFDKSNTPDHHRFSVLVNEVLILREPSDIRTLRLSSIDHTTFSNLYKWILAALARNVQAIHIEASAGSPIKFPNRLYTCPTLTTFRVSFGERIPKLELPERFCLPSLENLHLSHVHIGDVERASKLISNSPNLLRLEIDHCNFDVEGCFDIDSRKLEYLAIRNGVVNFSGSRDLYKFKVRIFAPNLETFACEDHLVREYVVMREFSRLRSSKVRLEMNRDQSYMALDELGINDDEKKEYVRRTTKLLEALQGTEDLVLTPWMLLVAFEPRAALQSLTLQFPNLKHLKLETRFSRDCALAIMHFLKASPNIKTLKIEIVKNSFSWTPHILNQNALTSANVGEWWELELSNECTFNHLKDVEILGIVGCMTEVKLVEIVLKKATTLERMVACTSDDKSFDKKKWLIKLSKILLKAPRASANVTLVIV